MANHIHQDKPFIFFTQKGRQSGNLAGRSGKKDIAAIAQQLLNFGVTVSDFALSIFRRTEFIKLFLVINSCMNYLI